MLASLSGVNSTNAVLSGNRYLAKRVWSGLSGTATITNGNTTALITHGLATTPAISDLILIPVQTNRYAATTNGFGITATTSTNFTITVNADPGTDLNFTWRHVD